MFRKFLVLGLACIFMCSFLAIFGLCFCLFVLFYLCLVLVLWVFFFLNSISNFNVWQELLQKNWISIHQSSGCSLERLSCGEWQNCKVSKQNDAEFACQWIVDNICQYLSVWELTVADRSWMLFRASCKKEQVLVRIKYLEGNIHLCMI